MVSQKTVIRDSSMVNGKYIDIGYLMPVTRVVELNNNEKRWLQFANDLSS